MRYYVGGYIPTGGSSFIEERFNFPAGVVKNVRMQVYNNGSDPDTQVVLRFGKYDRGTESLAVNNLRYVSKGEVVGYADELTVGIISQFFLEKGDSLFLRIDNPGSVAMFYLIVFDFFPSEQTRYTILKDDTKSGAQVHLVYTPYGRELVECVEIGAYGSSGANIDFMAFGMKTSLGHVGSDPLSSIDDDRYDMDFAGIGSSNFPVRVENPGIVLNKFEQLHVAVRGASGTTIYDPVVVVKSKVLRDRYDRASATFLDGDRVHLAT